MGIVEYLIGNGFKPYRAIYNKSTCKFEYEPDKYGLQYYSSTVPGMSDIRLIKGEIEVIYGLHEVNKPPTLIYPSLGVNDDEVNRVLIKQDVNEIYDKIIQCYDQRIKE